MVILGVVYPFIVYFGLDKYGPIFLAVFLLVLILLRWYFDTDNSFKWVYIVAIVMCLLTIVKSNEIWIQFYPVLMSFGFFSIFLYSLLYPPTIIERFARIKYPTLDQKATQWIYRVTVVWTVFFLLNGLIALGTVLYGSLDLWTLYNGLISYLLMGVIFVGEWILRFFKTKN